MRLSERTRRWSMRALWAGLLISASLLAGLQLGRPLVYTDGTTEIGAADLASGGMVRWNTPEPVAELPGPVTGRVAALPDGRLVYGRRTANGTADLVVFDPTRRDVAPEPAYGLNTEANELAPAFAADGQLFFASDRAGGNGGYDLFVAAVTRAGFGAPQPVAICNTALDETDPALHPDGALLVFARIDPQQAGGHAAGLWQVRLDGALDPTPVFAAPPRRRGWQADRDPAWSPAGNALWFVRQRAGAAPELLRASWLGGRFDRPQRIGARWGRTGLRAPLPDAGGAGLGLLAPARADGDADVWFRSEAEELTPWWLGQRALELWLLAIAGTCVLLLVLLHLGRRWSTLDLVAQCILLSLLLHVLLFLWLYGIALPGTPLPGPEDEGRMQVTIVAAAPRAASEAHSAASAVVARAAFDVAPRALVAAPPASAVDEAARTPVAAPAAAWPSDAAPATDAARAELDDRAAVEPPRAAVAGTRTPAPATMPAVEPEASVPDAALALHEGGAFVVGAPGAAVVRAPAPRLASAAQLPAVAGPTRAASGVTLTDDREALPVRSEVAGGAAVAPTAVAVGSSDHGDLVPERESALAAPAPAPMPAATWTLGPAPAPPASAPQREPVADAARPIAVDLALRDAPAAAPPPASETSRAREVVAVAAPVAEPGAAAASPIAAAARAAESPARAETVAVPGSAIHRAPVAAAAARPQRSTPAPPAGGGIRPEIALRDSAGADRIARADDAAAGPADPAPVAAATIAAPRQPADLSPQRARARAGASEVPVPATQLGRRPAPAPAPAAPPAAPRAAGTALHPAVALRDGAPASRAPAPAAARASAGRTGPAANTPDASDLANVPAPRASTAAVAARAAGDRAVERLEVEPPATQLARAASTALAQPTRRARERRAMRPAMVAPMPLRDAAAAPAAGASRASPEPAATGSRRHLEPLAATVQPSPTDVLRPHRVAVLDEVLEQPPRAEPPGSLLQRARAAAIEAAAASELPATAYSNRFGPAKARALAEFGGSAETERAVAEGLRYLAHIQNDDGTWGDRDDFDRRYGFVHVGKTALCVLAFLGAGHTPASHTAHSATVARAVEHLLAIQDPDTGAFGASSCYGHGIATYAIAECYGLTKAPHLLRPLEDALVWILEHQGPRRDRRNRGGWGYFSPGLRAEDDYARVSVTAWMVMALESARLSGIDLPPLALPRAREYLEESFDRTNKWFRYNHEPRRLASAWPTLPASTPAAAFCLLLLGAEGDDPRIAAAVDYTVERRPDAYRRYDNDAFVLRGQGNVYFWYYGSLCCFLAGGEAWQQWNERLRTVLPAAQSADGSFAPIDVYAREAGDTQRDRSYTTAMCVLSLEIYYRYFTPLLLGR